MPGFLGITSIAMIHHGKSSKIQGVGVLRACQTLQFSSDSKKSRIWFPLLQGRLWGERFLASAFQRRRIIGREGRRPLGGKEAICSGEQNHLKAS